MKYAIVLGLVGALAFAAGCSDDPKTTDTSSSSSGAGGESTVSSSSSSSGMGGMGTGGMGTGGMGTGGMGTGGMGTGGMGTGGMGTGGMGTGGAGGSGLVCDDATVVDKDDPAMRCANGNPVNVNTAIQAPANMVWASAVAMNGVSSEYSSGNMTYHAIQATGAPDVYPDSGDRPEAWASAMEDNQVEFIKVTYATPVMAKAVWVYETFNPGAISKITITAMDGDHVVYTKATPATVGTCSHILSASTKTCSPISAVRVDLDSPKVPGFNEIDAIGLVPAQ